MVPVQIVPSTANTIASVFLVSSENAPALLVTTRRTAHAAPMMALRDRCRKPCDFSLFEPEENFILISTLKTFRRSFLRASLDH